MALLILIEPIGGLGNQLFVYAVGLANAERLGTPLVADLTKISKDTVRGYELNTFASSVITKKVKPAPSMKSLFFKLHKASLLGKNGRYRNLHYEQHSGFDQRFLEIPDGARLRGYFQSWKYPLSVLERLRTEMWSVVRPSELFQAHCRELLAEEEWVAVHLRFGDYKGLEHMNLASSYYGESLRLLEAYKKQLKVVVFSDEPTLARKLPAWNGLHNLTFLGPDPQIKPIEHLLLMSLAPKIVIANSTFSWWAAYLADSPGKKVMFPRPWSSKHDDVADFIPPGWFGVSSR